MMSRKFRTDAAIASPLGERQSGVRAVPLNSVPVGRTGVRNVRDLWTVQPIVNLGREAVSFQQTIPLYCKRS